VYRFSVEQYHRMIEAGVLGPGDRAELLEGWIVAKMAHNPPHATALTRLTRKFARLLPDAWVLRIQLPLTTRESEPEPDATVVRGPEDEYEKRHPGPRDVGLVIEISDTTLDQDLGPKLRLYARSRIPCYWVINLVDRRIEVYTEPRGGRSPSYQRRQDYAEGDAVPVVIGGDDFGTMAVRDLLD
jgi:Uma2 family endonuclease